MLLLFGTKIVTLFGQRKNVFVKQKHSGQNVKCAVHEQTTVCGNTSVLFCFKCLNFGVNTEPPTWGFVYQETNLNFKPVRMVRTVHCLTSKSFLRSQRWMWCGDSNGGIGLFAFVDNSSGDQWLLVGVEQQHSANALRDLLRAMMLVMANRISLVHWKWPWILHPTAA